MQDAQEIWVPGNGGIFVAPVGTAAPTDATTPLPVAWQDLGLVSPDGVAITPALEESQVMTWQSPYPARRLVTARNLQAKGALLQVNTVTLALFFGGAVVSGSGSAYTLAPPDPALIDTRAWVYEGYEGSGAGLRKHRHYWPSGLVITFGDWVWTRSAAAAIDITVGLNALTPGNEWKHWVSDAQFSAT